MFHCLCINHIQVLFFAFLSCDFHLWASFVVKGCETVLFVTRCCRNLDLPLSGPLLGLGTGRCLYICYLDRTWIPNFTSSVVQMCNLSAILPDHSPLLQTADDVQWNASHAQPCSGRELSVARFHPGMAKCKHSSLRSTWAQPGNFYTCKWPHYYQVWEVQLVPVYVCSQPLQQVVKMWVQWRHQMMN